MNDAIARDTLRIVADNPASLAGVAQLSTAIDALALLYIEARPEGMTDRQAALRSPAAAWRMIHAHVEHRAASMPKC